MSTALVIAAATFFFGMGLVGLVRPSFILEIFGGRADTAPLRSEVRAVYGGFGVGVAALLITSLARPDVVGAAAILAIGVGIASMAAGRFISALVERDARFYPTWFFGLVEVAVASALIGAWLMRR